MRSRVARVLLFAVPGGYAAAAAVPVRTVRVHFEVGASHATVQVRIEGRDVVDYAFVARKGQSLAVALQASSRSASFNVTAPGAPEAVFIGASSGNRYEGTAPASGEYTVRLYLVRSAARRGETATFTFRFGVSGG